MGQVESAVFEDAPPWDMKMILNSTELQGVNKKWLPSLTILPPLDCIPKLVLSFLIDKIKSKLFCARWEPTVTIKIQKLLGKWSKRG